VFFFFRLVPGELGVDGGVHLSIRLDLAPFLRKENYLGVWHETNGKRVVP